MKIASSMIPTAAMAGSAGEFLTSKAWLHEASSPASLRRLISYRPSAANGPISAKPDTSGNNSGNALLPDVQTASTTPTSG
jgi:hypothetical protein